MRIRDAVDVMVHNGHASFHGIVSCGSIWECPPCSARIRALRAVEVERAARWHEARGGALYHLTLTVRHGLGDDLGTTRKGVARAWRRIQTGAAWGRFKERTGMVGSIRALEVTYGANGFHPHIHVLLFLRNILPTELAAVGAQLSTRWQDAVRARLGASAVPDFRHGCDLRPASRADYLAKLGLAHEIAAPAGKAARGSNRSPLEIAADFTTHGDSDDLRAWLRYCQGMRGARMLTWSGGLRKDAGLGAERSDEEIVAEPVSDADWSIGIAGTRWDAIRDIPGLLHRLLTAAESEGREATIRAIEEAANTPHRWRRSSALPSASPERKPTV